MGTLYKPAPGGPSIGDKWADLEIHCQGRAFLVHRAVVCSRSAMFAAQYEAALEQGNANVIEHDVFDAQTMEYMLNWIYEGKYILTVEPPIDDNSISMTSSDDSSGELVLVSQAEPDDSVDAVAHVRVYAIAQSFDLPELQDLALVKFSVVDVTQQIDSFAGVLYEVYNHTTYAGDPLRKQALIKALDAIDHLVQNDNFMNAISQEPSLQEFAPTILQAALRQARSHVHDETTELLGSLTLSSNEEIEALSSSYEKHLAELEAKLSHHDDAMKLLRSQLEKRQREADDLQSQLQEATSQSELQTRQLAQLTRDLEIKSDACSAIQLELTTTSKALRMRDSTSQAKQEQIDEATRKAKQTEDKLKAATNEANHFKQLSQQQTKEMERLVKANQNADATASGAASLEARLKECTTKLFAAQKAERDAKAAGQKQRDIMEEVVQMSMNWEECRNGGCMDDHGTFLDWDDRAGSCSGAVMLRCRNCRCRHYGTMFS